MQTKLSEMMGVEFPIYAFSHCRDVVAAVTRAGGFGVLGAGDHEPEELAEELRWIREQVGDLPFGIDMVLPNVDSEDISLIREQISQEYWDFAASLKERFSIPNPTKPVSDRIYGPARARAQWEVAKQFGVKCVVSALGPLPPDIVEDAHANGILVGGMCGAPSHAVRHVAGGADFIVAQGTEAGGHTGEITTFVLVPQVVDAVAPVPVLAAGGVGSGRQIAAAMALGAQGVWTGSIWLTSRESDLHPAAIEKLLAAESRDAKVSKARTGKRVRQLATPWVTAWEQPGAPAPLPAPYQKVLVRDQVMAIEEHGIREPIGSPVGQVVGMMNQQRSSAGIVNQLVNEYVECLGSMSGLVAE